MIAVVSSTIAPSSSPSHDGARTSFSPADRLTHTRGTVDSLLAGGVADILIVDNSAGGWRDEWSRTLSPARILHCDHPAYRNKGIGEMWLLLAALEQLPPDTPVIKISGRYRLGPQSPLFLPPKTDVAALVYHRRELSTRAYLLRDREVAGRLWRRTLAEMYRQPYRVVGPRSLLAAIRRLFQKAPAGEDLGDPTASIEIAIYDALRHLRLSLTPLDHLDLEGIMGSWNNPQVRE